MELIVGWTVEDLTPRDGFRIPEMLRYAVQAADALAKVTPLHALTKPVDLGLALSPDGRYLLFAQNDFSGSDLMLVENFK